MGREIVYCGGCGKSLREEEFAQGRAHVSDNRPYCAECKTPPAAERAPALAKGSSSRFPKAAAPTRRAVVARGSRKGLWAGIGVAAAAAVVLGIAVAPAGRPPESAPAPAPPAAGASLSPAADMAAAKPPVRPPEKPPEPVRAKASPPAIPPAESARELEALEASGVDPAVVLQRCDAVGPLLKGTPEEPRLRAVVALAQERRKARQVEVTIGESGRLMASPHALERKEEILNLLRAAREIAGARRGEVERMIADFEKRVREESASASALPDRGAAADKPAPATTAPAPQGGKTLYSERFDSGAGRFAGGELVTDGSQALSVPAGGVSIWKAFTFRVGPATRVRFRLKPAGRVPQVTVMVWSPRHGDNARYFIRNLKDGEWNAIDFRAAELRTMWDRSGASIEGDVLDNLKLLVQGERGSDARLLLDDFEVIE